MSMKRELLRRGVAIGVILAAQSIGWVPSATVLRALSSSESATLQEGCGYTSTYTARSSDTLCCPSRDGEQTCVQVWCTNYFCRVVFPIGNRQCWQDLYLCALLFCAEDNSVRELWAEDDRDIACPPGPILTGSRFSGVCEGGDYVRHRHVETCAVDFHGVRRSSVAARLSSGVGGR